MSTAINPSLFNQYRPLPGCYDEFATPDGAVRDIWKPLTQRFDQLGQSELLHRWEQAKQFIQENGIRFVSNGDPTLPGENLDRPWEFDFLPLLFAQKEWDKIDKGLAQRARLLNAILKDLFTSQTLIRENALPAELLLGHPGFFPSYSNLPVVNETYLHLYAADLSRNSLGNWMICGDRTRAPFGLGYALENRVVTSRMLSGIFQQLQVKRHATFFKTLQQTFRGLAVTNKSNPFIVLLSKGPESNFHYEDAYLARYLGYTLVEGKDLAVRNGRLSVKTLTGLVDVDVVFRRVEDDDLDPVELRGVTGHGIAGLLTAVRNNEVMVANAPGSRLVESPVFLPFLNSICQKLFGEDLLIPSLNTWWCGQKNEMQYVFDHLDTLQIRPAFRESHYVHAIEPRELTKAKKTELIAKIKSCPSDYIAQEYVQRSTTPAWNDNQIVPWFMALRCFLVATEKDYTSLPGGLIRVSPNQRELEYSMTDGTRSQDAWILSDSPVEQISLLKPDTAKVTLLRSGNELPSRVADDFFWLGRYLEQADGEARLLRSVINRLGAEVQLSNLPEREGLFRLMAAIDLIDPGFVIAEMQPTLPRPEEYLNRFLSSPTADDPFLKTLNNVARVAVQVRDRLSHDAWRMILQVKNFVREMLNSETQTDESEILNRLNRLISAFNGFGGFVNESMTRTHAWRFLDMGRRMERAMMVQSLCGAILQQSNHHNAPTLELLLEICDCEMTYRTRYRSRVQLPAVLDMLLTDETTPRSVAFQMLRIDEHISQLPRDLPQGVYAQEQQASMELLLHLRKLDVFKLSSSESLEDLTRIQTCLENISKTLSHTYLHHIGKPSQMVYTHNRIE